MKILKVLAALATLCLANVGYAQKSISVWPGPAPGTEKAVDKEMIVGDNVVDVYQPELRVFLPAKKNVNRPAVLVFPGGGYRQIVMKKEGTKIAEWLNENGAAAFVLKYRLSREAALQDAQRALSLIRSKAKEFDIDPGRIGVIGFSAGGHLGANLATHYDGRTIRDSVDSISCRPDFVILVYAAVGERICNSVRAGTPPAFVVHASDDNKVPVDQSLKFFSALQGAGVPSELHIYSRGGHGFALESGRGPVTCWAGLCIDWMKVNNFIGD